MEHANIALVHCKGLGYLFLMHNTGVHGATCKVDTLPLQRARLGEQSALRSFVVGAVRALLPAWT